MTVEFYLFDVSHGQAAAVKLPNGRWCLFDAGSKADFSPVQFVRTLETGIPGLATGILGGLGVPSLAGSTILPGILGGPLPPPFKFLKATISHLHGDHLMDQANLFQTPPEYLRTVEYDAQYLNDVRDTSSPDSLRVIEQFCLRRVDTFGPHVAQNIDYGGATIQELSLPVLIARHIGGAANSRVNNASIVSRINYWGRTILICGDLEAEGWQFALRDALWRALVSNVDVLVAPHHGHVSGYSSELMALTKPSVVLASVRSGDDAVDPRYSSDVVRGIQVNGRLHKCITTRRQRGHIHLSIAPLGGLLTPNQFALDQMTWEI